jgi:hypothetical protein
VLPGRSPTQWRQLARIALQVFILGALLDPVPNAQLDLILLTFQLFVRYALPELFQLL